MQAPLKDSPSTSYRLSSLDIPKQLEILEAVNRLAHLLNKRQPGEETTEKLINTFMNIVNADEGSIQLLRPTSQVTRRTLIRSGAENISHLDQRLDDLLTGLAVRDKQVVLINDIFSTLDIKKTTKRYAHIQSILAAPLIVQDQPIGVVNLVRLKQAESFTETEQQIATFLVDEIAEFIGQSHLREKLFDECERLRKELGDRFTIHGIIGRSAAMKEVFSLLERVFPTDGRVLIQGESGTGKELIARIIHYAGPRKNHPFVAVDCSALPPNLLESELFGYVRGAFTGANRDRKGLFEEANCGTLFLDEIVNMNIDTQSKLLRALQEGEIRPLGSNKSRKVDVRIIAAASMNIKEKVTSGEFRSDLYYRLNVVPIHLPALRERDGDIALLASHFLKKFVEKHRKKLFTISHSAIKIMEQHPWHGNVRELENVIERAVILAGVDDVSLTPEHLPYELSFADNQQSHFELPLSGDYPSLIANYEREILLRVLRHHNWNQSAAARALSLSERVIRYKMKQLKLEKPKV